MTAGASDFSHLVVAHRIGDSLRGVPRMMGKVNAMGVENGCIETETVAEEGLETLD